MMRMVILLLALLGSGASAAPPTDNFNAELIAENYKEAGKILNQMIEQRRPANGRPAPDGLLNARLGRFSQSYGGSEAAATYLAFADFEQLPEAERAPTLLAYADALVWLGNRERALTAFRQAAVFAHDGSVDRRRALVGAASQSIVADPLSGRNDLMAIASLPKAPDRWEAEYWLAIASSLTGDRISALAYAERAWNDAAKAPAKEMAPLRVAVLRAGLAAAARDRNQERAMLAAANAPTVQENGEITARLPICGDNGVQPSDFVVVGIARAPYNEILLSPIAASRPQIVASFYDRLSGIALLNGGQFGAGGTVATLSCRSAVSGAYLAKESYRDPLDRWFIERGLYSAITMETDPIEQINELGRRVEALETRYGKDCLLSLPLKFHLLRLLEQQAHAGESVAPGRLLELRTSIANQLRIAGAPEGVANAIELRTETDRLTRAAMEGKPDFAGMELVFRKLAMALPFPSAQVQLTAIPKEQSGAVAATRARLYTALNKRTPATLKGRDRQAWLLAVTDAQIVGGMERESRVTLASARFQADLCVASDTEPNMVENNYKNDDFPRDLVAGDQAGLTVFELDIAADGSVRSPRTILSMPSGLFDQAAASKVLQSRYTSPKRNGKSVTCRGQVQRVRWRLPPERDVVELPTLAPLELPETS